MSTLTKLDWDLINARVEIIRGQRQLPSASQAFLWLVLQQFFPSQDTDFYEIITDGPDDRGVDAINVVTSEGYADIYVFQSKYRDKIENTKKTINADEILKTANFIAELMNKSSDLSSCNNLRLREAVARIWELHEAGVYCRYKIIFCSNDGGLSHASRSTLESFVAEHPQVSYSQYDSGCLIRDASYSRRVRESGHLQVVAKEIFERADGDVRGLVASVDARSFIDLITESDNKTVKRHLFDENLRVFLGLNAGYNAGIVETATSQDSYLFWYLNNGITITCSNLSYNKGHPNPKILLQDFQIVNGAQTSHSLVEASLRNPAALENVILNVRVYATEREDIAERVAVATNSQARIQGRDLRANHPILKKLEMALLSRGLFFERKRNMYQEYDPALRVDALKLGQIIMAFYLKEPDLARTQSDSIFDARFSAIFSESLDVDELVRVIQLYARIEALREEFLARYGDFIESGGAYQYLVYGHWFMLFAARLLLLKESRPVPSAGEAEKLVDEAIDLVARACDQPKQVAHYQMFRSPRTKEKIMAELMGKQLELFVF